MDIFKLEDLLDVYYIGKLIENFKLFDSFGNKYNVIIMLFM